MKIKKTFIAVMGLALVFACSSACNNNPPVVEKQLVEATKDAVPAAASAAPTPWCDKTAKGCVRFAVLGDFGDQRKFDGSPEKHVAKMVTGWEPQFIITVGDNNYPCGKTDTIVANSQPYCDYIYNPGAKPSPCSGTATVNQRNAFFPVLGNHEWYSKDAEPYVAFFTGLPANSSGSHQPNRRYYDLTWETQDGQASPVHLFALDSEDQRAIEAQCGLSFQTATYEPDGATVNSVQYNWYKAALGKAKEPWKIAYFHHPPYVCGSGSEWMRWDFETLGTNVVLAGHQHAYQRFAQSNTAEYPHIINGAGGTELHGCQAMGNGFVKQHKVTKQYGAMLVEATNTTITFFFYTTDGTAATLSDWVRVTKDNSASGQKMTCQGC